MKKNKLSRIEDFILPTFFIYQSDMFEYSHNFRYKSKSFKTKFCKNVLEQKLFTGKNRKVINKHLGKGTFFAKLPVTNRTGLCSNEPFHLKVQEATEQTLPPKGAGGSGGTQSGALDVQRNEFIIISRKICHQEITKVFLHSTYKTNYTITRPVINWPRKTITMMCRLSRLPVYPDLTNSKVRYARNRIRKQIIPTLQFFLNPKVEKALFKFSEFYNKAF